MKNIVLVFGLLFCTFDVIAKDDIAYINKISDEMESCSKQFETKEQECPDSWSMKCYDHLMKANQDTQNCYQKVAIKIFEKFYKLTNEKADKKINEYRNFIYDQYSFMYFETDFCKKNNCGISLNLYSEYATTQELELYLKKMIGAILARL